MAEHNSFGEVILDSRGVWWFSRFWAESFEAWWDGQRVAHSTYRDGMKFEVSCSPGSCLLELLPQHTNGAMQRFRVTIPDGRWVMRSSFVVGFMNVGWSEPILYPSQNSKTGTTTRKA